MIINKKEGKIKIGEEGKGNERGRLEGRKSGNEKDVMRTVEKE